MPPKIEQLPEPQRTTVIAALTESVLLEVSETIDNRLNESQKAELQELLANNSTPAEVYSYLHDNVVGFEELVSQATERKKAGLYQTYQALYETLNQAS
jgi:hypothetical protein